MAKSTLDQLVDTMHMAAGKAADIANDLTARGKNKLNQISLERELAKAQRQLGTLVYSMKKAGEENPALVDQYIRVIEQLEKKLNEQEAAQAARYCTPICPSCGKEIKEKDRFCAHCGEKLF